MLCVCTQGEGSRRVTGAGIGGGGQEKGRQAAGMELEASVASPSPALPQPQRAQCSAEHSFTAVGLRWTWRSHSVHVV